MQHEAVGKDALPCSYCGVLGAGVGAEVLPPGKRQRSMEFESESMVLFFWGNSDERHEFIALLSEPVAHSYM